MVSARLLFGVSAIFASQAQFQQPAFFVPQAQFSQPALPDFTQHSFQQFRVQAAFTPDFKQSQQFQPVPGATQFWMSPHDQTQSGLQAPASDSGSCGPAADLDSECCKVEQESNPLAQGSPLFIGGIYCAQAADSRWWNVQILKRNCDGSYRSVVQDDAKTEWAETQRTMILDLSCEDYWNQALQEMGQPPMPVPERPAPEPVEAPLESAPAPVESAGWIEHPVEPLHDRVPRRLTPEEPQGGRFPIGEKGAKSKVPWKVITGAAAAGALPIVYHMSS